MAKEHHIYKNNIGWFVEMPDTIEGPLESREEAVRLANLLKRVGMARTAEVACTEQECF